jgi:hypothetical protein
MKQQTYTHIKRPLADGPSDDALCGSVSGCAYITLGRDDQIPDTAFPPCPTCALTHIKQHYGGLEAEATTSAKG